MSHSIFVNRGTGQSMPTAVHRADLTVVSVKDRLAQCLPCAWNVGNRCQHPAQKCAPCKQGRGLQAALAGSDFKCPVGNF